MRDLLPAEVLNSLHDRYRAGVNEAEAMFEESEADEDALTGALGQAISMPLAQTFITEKGIYVVKIGYRKIPGRGKGAPEKTLGADGIFQAIISDAEGNAVFQKGLPFQSKKRWKGKLKKLWHQCELMEKQAPGGIAIDLSELGYKACTAVDVIERQGSRASLDKDGKMKSLGTVLGVDFLECSAGRVGLFYDGKKKKWGDFAPSHVFTTHIQTSGGDT